MFMQNSVVLISVRTVLLLILCTGFCQHILICGTSVLQPVDGGNVYTSLNESIENNSLQDDTPDQLSLLTRMFALKYQLNTLRSRVHSDSRGKKAAAQPYSDITSLMLALWSHDVENEVSKTLQYFTTNESLQPTPISVSSDGRLQGHDVVNEFKENKPFAPEPKTPSALSPPILQNNSDAKFNRKIVHSSGYEQHSRVKGYGSGMPNLRLAIESCNFTILYPGNNRGSQFFGSDAIFLKDVAFNKKGTWFLLKVHDTAGEAYMDSSSLLPESQMFYCIVRGHSEEIIYSGWHRWGNESSGAKSLSCETACKSTGTEPFAITQYHLHLDSDSSWAEYEQRNVKLKQVICLQPIYSGLYICIAVDSKYNVFLSSSYDLRVVNVVTAKDATIAPPSATISQNDTRQTFIDRYCTGYFSPRQNADKYSAEEVDFFYLNETNYENESFIVKTLHTLKWIKAEKLFENLNLALPVIIRCKLDIQTLGYIERRYMELYFRHHGITNKIQNTFTAVRNETLTFSCFEDTFDRSKSVRASYSEGVCSETPTVSRSQNSSSIKLRMNTDICVKCSSLSSEIRLQINVEQDLRTLTSKTEDEQLQGNCRALHNVDTEIFTAENSGACEQNAISLLKGTQEYRNRVISFTPHTYKLYYTPRQFIVCRDQPIPGSATPDNQANSSSENAVITIVICATAVTFALLLLFTWKRKCSPVKLIRKIRDKTRSNFLSFSLKRNSALFIDDILNAMDRVHPRENIERSRISIKDSLYLGKFGQLYKACLKSNANSDDGHEVAVEEHKWPTCRTGKRAYLHQINQQIQVLRVITPHINILRYYGFSISPESNLIVMELVNGIDLLAYLHQQRTRVPDFVFKVRYRVRSETKSDIINATCSSVDFSDGRIVNNANHRDMMNAKHNSELQHDSNNVKVEATINQRKDSNRSDGDVSETNQGIWSVHFENDSLHNEEDPKDLTESNPAVYSREFDNTAANESLVMGILSVYRQVARAMAHLSSLNIILCDLTASSVVVQLREYPLVVKICDFSSAYRLPEGETVYKRSNTGCQRVKWMQPEAVKKGELTLLSDVWSYGVFCWEVATLGSYEETRASTKASRAYKSKNPHRPPGCDEDIFAVIESCWKINPEERPSFEDLVEKWSDILEVNSDYLELKNDLNYEDTLAILKENS